MVVEQHVDALHLHILSTFDHRVTEWAFGSMPLTAFSKARPGKRLAFLEVRFVDTTWISGVTVIHFVQSFSTSHARNLMRSQQR